MDNFIFWDLVIFYWFFTSQVSWGCILDIVIALLWKFCVLLYSSKGCSLTCLGSNSKFCLLCGTSHFSSLIFSWAYWQPALHMRVSRIGLTFGQSLCAEFGISPSWLCFWDSPSLSRGCGCPEIWFLVIRKAAEFLEVLLISCGADWSITKS